MSYRSYSKEDLLEVVMSTPGLGYFEFASVVIIELNRANEQCWVDILSYIDSKSISFERGDDIIVFSELSVIEYMLDILLYIRDRVRLELFG